MSQGQPGKTEILQNAKQLFELFFTGSPGQA